MAARGGGQAEDARRRQGPSQAQVSAGSGEHASRHIRRVTSPTFRAANSPLARAAGHHATTAKHQAAQLQRRQRAGLAAPARSSGTQPLTAGASARSPPCRPPAGMCSCSKPGSRARLKSSTSPSATSSKRQAAQSKRNACWQLGSQGARGEGSGGVPPSLRGRRRRRRCGGDARVVRPMSCRQSDRVGHAVRPCRRRRPATGSWWRCGGSTRSCSPRTRAW